MGIDARHLEVVGAGFSDVSVTEKSFMKEEGTFKISSMSMLLIAKVELAGGANFGVLQSAEKEIYASTRGKRSPDVSPVK